MMDRRVIALDLEIFSMGVNLPKLDQRCPSSTYLQNKGN